MLSKGALCINSSLFQPGIIFQTCPLEKPIVDTPVLNYQPDIALLTFQNTNAVKLRNNRCLIVNFCRKN